MNDEPVNPGPCAVMLSKLRSLLLTVSLLSSPCSGVMATSYPLNVLLLQVVLSGACSTYPTYDVLDAASSGYSRLYANKDTLALEITSTVRIHRRTASGRFRLFILPYHNSHTQWQGAPHVDVVHLTRPFLLAQAAPTGCMRLCCSSFVLCPATLVRLTCCAALAHKRMAGQATFVLIYIYDS